MKNRLYTSPVCILATPMMSFASRNPLPPNKMEARGHLHAAVVLMTAKQLLIRSEIECEFFNLPNPSGRTRPWSLLSL
jgi:hypothetical protein